ncbi:hypothetical protein PACTADRAFT_33409 [Pachysolen tannophilus NRRL Y-2460]|uniref:Uncharacterized protein n=1 Tax=Pachysolen tannophilus NRRL Y-2460 TaxID=669874 RepID=A0A1E4TWW5_PACTA|nr:hypothetical protein PACTADRAFT_33409 [Pachysolen tannophilus NRRL Y-2460]
MDLPKTNEKLKEKLLKQEQNMINSRQIAERKAEAAQELTEDEKHTIELIGFIKKSKAPALISYIKKNKLSPDFELKPSSEYATTPTLLHCATYNNIPYITQVLLNNLKANPCIKNDLGKTPFELTSNKEIKKIFQIARYNLGEVYCNWVEDAHVNLPAKSKEEFLDEEEKLKSKEENDKKLLHEKELQAYQKEIATERVAKYGTGKSLGNVMTSISNQSMLNQLSDEQKMRLMREQRARAAEARMNRKN